MRKSLFALAVLGLSAGAGSAQSSVNIYGIADMGLTWEKADPAGTRIGLDSGAQSGSRIGFRGTEDLGGGLSALFLLEAGMEMDTGVGSQANKLFGREANVGLKGKFGTVRMGLQYSPYFKAASGIDAMPGTGFAGDILNLFDVGGSRVNNALIYSTPDMGGLSADVMYGFGEEPGNNSARRRTALGLTYKTGPVHGRFVHQRNNNATGTDTTKFTIAGGSYNFGPATAHAGYAVKKNDRNTDNIRSQMVGVTVPVGEHALFASHTRAKDKVNADADANATAVGFSYTLSKRTEIYTAYGVMKNDANADYTVEVAGTTRKLFTVGMLHSF